MSSIDSLSAVYQQQSFQPPRGDNPMDKVMSKVADLFGMSGDELREAQRDGKTLNDIAKEKGVSSDDLQSTLTDALKANAPSDAPVDTDYSQMAIDIASGTGPQHAGGHGHRHGGGLERLNSDGSNSTTSELSSLLSSLGIDPSQLVDLLSTDSSSSSSTTTTSDDSSSDFASQLKGLLAQYGSKGNLYDTTL